MENKKLKILVIVFIVLILAGIITAFIVVGKKSNSVSSNLDTGLAESNQLEEVNVTSNEILDEDILTNEIQENKDKENNGNILTEDTKTQDKTSVVKDESSKSKDQSSQSKGDTSPSKNTSQNSNSSKKTGKTKYYIKVNYGAQVVTIYKKDDNGYYTVPYKAMICSTGTATPKSGTYEIPGRWNWGGLEGDVYGQYITVITGNILFHSVPYLERYNPGSLKTAEYDKLGTPASAGCVRLTVADALWIHQNCEDGTKVEFYSSSNPGPLGKPKAQKISNATGDLRNWDPTDPDSNNPWNKPATNTSSEKEEPSNPSKEPDINTTKNTKEETKVNTTSTQEIDVDDTITLTINEVVSSTTTLEK